MWEIDTLASYGQATPGTGQSSNMMVVGTLSTLQELDRTPGVEFDANSTMTFIPSQLKPFHIASQFCSGYRTNTQVQSKSCNAIFCVISNQGSSCSMA
ncbi:unnamed protein product [Linum trigynum]|uniref:Uncharacterized protein n=1 Tax=Linum trigynum TaxID=586398 RepID=A0AAV2DJX1_9ROSI